MIQFMFSCSVHWLPLRLSLLSAEEWVKLVPEAGEFGVKTMALLDAANTGTYGNPEITKGEYQCEESSGNFD